MITTSYEFDAISTIIIGLLLMKIKEIICQKLEKKFVIVKNVFNKKVKEMLMKRN